MSFEETTFCKCCNNREELEYSIKHDPKPLQLSSDDLNTIEMILWYMPNIDSVQASKNELIEEEIYDDFTFRHILDTMGMNENDVCFYPPNTDIPNGTWDYYQNRICNNCQKIVIVRQNNQTKTLNLLRCVRNSVAHGDFTICGDFFIGFNTYRGRRKAIIKLKAKMLLNALDMLNKAYTKEKLYTYILEKAGYEYRIPDSKSFVAPIADYLITKDTRSYYIQFKYTEGEKRYVSDMTFTKWYYFYESNNILNNTEHIPFVIVVENVKVKKQHIELLHRVGVEVIDYSKYKELLNGTDVFLTVNPTWDNPSEVQPWQL